MRKTRILHKDGDKTAITLVWVLNKYLKINRELWDKEDMVLNRYYKAILTRSIKASEKIVFKYEKEINYSAEKEVMEILNVSFEAFDYDETDENLEILKTMFYVLIIFGTLKKHKKMMLGVVLKSMITDVFKGFEDFRVMWLREIDDSVLSLEK
nr:dynein heavy chain 2 [uncultured Fusobacterium sp.]